MAATELGTAEARFLVPNQDLELDRPAAEPTLMAQLAEMTKPAGGAALAAEELPDLLKRLADKPPELKEEVIAKVTYWDTWPFFLIFVGLLGRRVVFAEAVGIGVARFWAQLVYFSDGTRSVPATFLSPTHVQWRSDVMRTVSRSKPKPATRSPISSTVSAARRESAKRLRW